MPSASSPTKSFEIGRASCRERCRSLCDWSSDVCSSDLVQGVIVVEYPSGIRGQCGVAATIDNAERIIAHEVFRKPDAARAENATLIVQHNARAEIYALGLVHLRLDEAALGLTVIHRILLQFTFTRLIANRTVERMID